MTATRPKVLAIIMAGGKGERLYPLTKERSKPAVPYGGKYRIIDFVLSNFINSGILSCYVLVQYLSQSLIEYLRMSWRSVGITRDHFITTVPPQMRLGEAWYRGTADAVRQNLNLIYDFNPDIVAVFGADHIYRMDIGQMLDFHLDAKADLTVAALPVPVQKASAFGVIEADAQGRIQGFAEKPQSPQAIPGQPDLAYSSMGNYLFSRETLLQILSRDIAKDGELDFGRSILPMASKEYRAFAYNFHANSLPGARPHEEQAYWRDVGSIQQFWESHMDLLGARPALDLDNPRWPIHSGRYDGPPAKMLNAEADNCLVGEGCVLKKSTLRNSVLGRGVIVHENCAIQDSIVMDYCEIQPGTKIRGAVVDRFNVLGPRESIGFDPAGDSERFYVDSSGIVVIPRGRTRV